MLKVPGVILVQEELLEKLGTLALVVILELMGRLEKWVYKVSMDPKAARVHRVFLAHLGDKEKQVSKVPKETKVHLVMQAHRESADVLVKKEPEVVWEE